MSGALMAHRGAVAAGPTGTPPAPSLPFTASWPGTGGAAWPSPWTAGAATTGGSATQSGSGTGLVTVAASTTQVLLLPHSVEDVEILTRIERNAVSSNAQTWLHLYARWDDTDQTGFRFVVSSTGGITQMDLFHPVNGFSSHNIGSGAWTPTTDPWWLRFRVEGDTTSVKWWLDGDPEPGSWSASTSALTGLQRLGRTGLAYQRGSGSTGSSRFLITHDFQVTAI